MPTLSSAKEDIVAHALDKQAIADCLLEQKQGTESAVDNTQGVFSFKATDQVQNCSSTNGLALSDDSAEPTPCSSSSTTSSSESPKSINNSIRTNQELKADATVTHQEDNKNEQAIDVEVGVQSCYDPLLDDEIRARLDKLNALSDLINSLELQFDQANCLFREILKCSTSRLSEIAKKLGSKSISYGRDYNAAKISVEQSQSECQRACVQFEQANNDHQFAKEAIKKAELRLKEVVLNSGQVPNLPIQKSTAPSTSELPAINDTDSIDLSRIKLDGSESYLSENNIEGTESFDTNRHKKTSDSAFNSKQEIQLDDLNRSERRMPEQVCDDNGSKKSLPTDAGGCPASSPDAKLNDAAELSETLNSAVLRLLVAEQKRQQSERFHFNQANKLMIAQENLQRLEREHGTSIRRSQMYFDEANRFKARLNSVKSYIRRISDEISAAKQAYAKTLSDLEQFSEDLHLMTAKANLQR